MVFVAVAAAIFLSKGAFFPGNRNGGAGSAHKGSLRSGSDRTEGSGVVSKTRPKDRMLENVAPVQEQLLPIRKIQPSSRLAVSGIRAKAETKKPSGGNRPIGEAAGKPERMQDKPDTRGVTGAASGRFKPTVERKSPASANQEEKSLEVVRAREAVQAPRTKKSDASEAGAFDGGAMAKAGPPTGGLLSDARKLPAESGLTLQAISWSESPQKRIAVINARILKEGDRIEKYVLWQIDREEVVFKHSDQMWKLGFQPR